VAKAGRTPREVALEREQRAWKMRQQLYTHERIAAELGVDRSTVTKMLARVGKRYLNSIQNEVAALKAEQFAQLAHIADEAMQAWRASKQPKKEARKVSRKQTKRGDEEATVAQTKEQNGDWHHLEMARAALADIRKIFGLDQAVPVGVDKPFVVREIVVEVPSASMVSGERPAQAQDAPGPGESMAKP
jgi:DNA-binding transcriptional MocR family regulator